MLSQPFKITLDAASKRQRDANGFLVVKDNPIAKAGVFEYAGAEIGVRDKEIYKVYRPFDELLKSKSLFEGKPILFNHEWVNPSQMPKVRGAISGNVEEKPPYLYADLVIYDEGLINEIESGRTVELSPGYLARYEPESGEFEGQAYQYTQRDIRFNHLAVVETGRSGDDLKVMDAKLNKGDDLMPTSKSKITMDEDKRQVMSEIEGMLKGKVDEELWRTIAAKLEKIAYEPSTESKADDEEPAKLEEAKDANSAEDVKTALNELAAKFDKFLTQESREPQHQSQDKTCDEGDEKEEKEEKEGMKVADAATIQAVIEKNYAKTMDAYNTVKPHTGQFNLYANGRLATENEVYAYGLKCLRGEEMKVTDAKSAFLAYVEARGTINTVKTQDSFTTVGDELKKMTGNIL